MISFIINFSKNVLYQKKKLSHKRLIRYNVFQMLKNIMVYERSFFDIEKKIVTSGEYMKISRRYQKKADDVNVIFIENIFI